MEDRINLLEDKVDKQGKNIAELADICKDCATLIGLLNKKVRELSKECEDLKPRH